MAQYDTRLESERVSGWAVGGITFAATMLIMIGAFQVISGIAAIAEDDFLVLTANYVFDLDVTAWGWIHLLLGVVMLLAGFGLFSGAAWAGVTAITIAVLSAVANFFFIPYYPFWSILVIGLDVWVVWALTRPGAIRS
jgi:hypothetical protein